MRLGHASRRGLAVPEWVAILSVLGMVIVLTIGFAGNSTATKMDADLNGAGGILGRQSQAATGSAAVGNTSKPKGNNGLGNGIDGAPSENAPVNDGEGTAPGSPGVTQ